MRSAESSVTVEGSRFVARAVAAGTRVEAEAVLAELRRRYHDATHHCFAFRLGTGGEEFRFSDDGEPSGTAGRPILLCIERRELTNCLVVVTRYFGGTKLGTGGLARAYGSAAEQVLSLAGSTVYHVTESLIVSFPHERTGPVMRCISAAGARISDTMYDEEVHLTVEIRQSLVGNLRNILTDATAGNIRIRLQPVTKETPDG